MSLKTQITYDEFSKVDLRVGKVLEAFKVEESEKLLKILVDLGEEKRTIFAGLKHFIKPEEIEGKNLVIVANLKSKKMMGEESCGMILAADSEDQPVLLTVDDSVKPGTPLR